MQVSTCPPTGRLLSRLVLLVNRPHKGQNRWRHAWHVQKGRILRVVPSVIRPSMVRYYEPMLFIASVILDAIFSGCYVSTIGATTETPCPAGSASSRMGASACQVCAAGSYSLSRAIFCTAASAGKVSMIH